MGQEDVYGRFARYYDAYVGDFARDVPVYLSLCRKEHAILEVGCGTGRILQAFLEADYFIDGTDISFDMLGASYRKLAEYIRDGSLRLSNHDFADAAMPETYDRILVTFYTFNYLLEPERQLRFLRNIYKSLKDGGKIVLDLFYPQVLAETENCRNWREKSFLLDGQPVLLRDKRQMLDEHIEERRQIFGYQQEEEEIRTLRRYIDKQAIRQLLEKAGFFAVQCCNGYQVDGFHEIAEQEQTESSFVVMAEK